MRDLSKWKNRDFSWSQMSSWEYDPESWFRAYILGERSVSREMTYGSYIDKKIQNDPKFIPSLPRYPLMQHRMNAVFGKIPLVGLPDGLNLEKYHLADYKTGKKAWDKKRAEETGQLKFYLLLLYICKKLNPELFTCYIHWLPTRENGDFSISLIDENVFHTFETKCTMKQLLEFGARVNATYEAMEKYAQDHI